MPASEQAHAGAAEAARPPSSTPGIVLAWGAFWALMIARAVHEHTVLDGHPLWKPLLWEGSSMLVATAILAMQWRRIHELDALLSSAWRWLARALRPAPALALGFVIAVYGLRHAVFALLGLVYKHAPWPSVLLVESLQFLIFYLLFLGLIFAMRSHSALAAERARVERHQALVREAQLLQLAQQIEPHFLFNALNTIAALVHNDPDRADILLVRLAGLLRAATDLARKPESSLDEELHLLAAYAELMTERFEGRVAVHFDIDAHAHSCRVPTLSLQPLLENCFRHGVERTTRPVRIDVTARCQASRLHIAISDDAMPLALDVQPGVGLGNVRSRLAALHGHQAHLSLAPRSDSERGATVRMELPCGC